MNDESLRYAGMSYEQASREAERLIGREGWFRSFEKLKALRDIMQRELWRDADAA